MADKQISDLTAVTPPVTNAALAHIKEGSNSRKATMAQMGACKVLVSAQDVVNQASVNFTSVITSAFDEYELHIVELVPLTDNTDLWIRFSTDNGGSWDATVGNYVRARNTQLSSGTTFPGDSSTSDSKIVIAVACGNATGETVIGRFQIANPNSASLYKIVHGSSGQYYSGAQALGSLITGTYKVATAVNALQLLMSSGNITGKFRLYGIRHG
jgi:hypothetical protein